MLSDTLQAQAFAVGASCKPVSEFAPVERFKVPDNQEVLWVQVKHNSAHFRNNYVVFTSACALLSLLLDPKTTVLFTCIAMCTLCVCNQTANRNHQLAAAYDGRSHKQLPFPSRVRRLRWSGAVWSPRCHA
jgi:hypothetical protein